MRAAPEVEPNKTIAAQVAQARHSAGISQAELGSRIGSDAAHISRIESGATQPLPPTIQRIAAALGVEFVIAGTPKDL